MAQPADPAATAFDRPEIFLSLGLSLARQGKAAALAQLVAETLAAHPAEPVYAKLARIISARGLPPYHRQMLVDHRRNAAYRRAIEREAKGRVVLDIGTGSGLLAMMAARAGAGRVIACEVNALLAETARKIIAANGLADQIEVHACHSSELTRTDIAPGGVDMVVSEIFSAGLVGEGVLPALEHARAELCAPDALFIPESASLRVALADLPDPRPDLRAIEGFDLSAFNGHFDEVETVENGAPDLALRSDVAQLCPFTFTAGTPIPQTSTDRADVTATGGPVSGVAQWLQIGFGAGETYENAPGTDPLAHWCVLFHRLPEMLDRAAGEVVKVEAFHHGDALAVWAG